MACALVLDSTRLKVGNEILPFDEHISHLFEVLEELLALFAQIFDRLDVGLVDDDDQRLVGEERLDVAE